MSLNRIHQNAPPRYKRYFSNLRDTKDEVPLKLIEDDKIIWLISSQGIFSIR